MAEYQNLRHEFEPVFDRHSRILILGTFPSVKSRESHFYYGHPQNRFWKVIAGLTGYPLPVSREEKTEMLLRSHIALWDVIASCDIIGSGDGSIRNVIPADLGRILKQCEIRQIYANGSTARRLYEKYQEPVCGREIIGLPSTSPANAAYRMDRLMEHWKVILGQIASQSDTFPDS